MYRIKQFIWALSSIFTKVDYEIIDRYLDNEERKIFFRLSKSEQCHSIRVCKCCLRQIGNDLDENTMAKIALLHDIGKINFKLNIVEKSILIILKKVANIDYCKFRNGKVRNYYNHPKESVRLLKQMNDKNYDDNLLVAIENHHNDVKIDNEYLYILINADNRN